MAVILFPICAIQDFMMSSDIFLCHDHERVNFSFSSMYHKWKEIVYFCKWRYYNNKMKYPVGMWVREGKRMCLYFSLLCFICCFPPSPTGLILFIHVMNYFLKREVLIFPFVYYRVVLCITIMKILEGT